VFALPLLCAACVGAGEYFVTPTGNDTNPGTAPKPFATLQRAADVMEAGDTCRIRRGVYRETVEAKGSGAPGKPIRFVAVEGEEVILSGAEPIQVEWTVHKSSILKAKVEQAVNQLFVDGEMMVEARWPNQPFEKRWDKSTWRPNGHGSEYGKIADPELAESGVNWTGALAVLNVGMWETYLRPVQNHAAGQAWFNYAKGLSERHEAKWPLRNRTRPGYDRYFIYGKLDALDSPGEWFYDRAAKTLYLWPPSGKRPSDCRIEGKVREYGFIALGKSHIQLDGLRFFASTVLFETANDCAIENCTFDYPTYVVPTKRLDGSEPRVPKRTRRFAQRFFGGLRVLAPTWIEGKRNLIRNCRVAFSEGAGFMVLGSEGTIENCLIHDIDWRGLGNGCIYNGGGVYLGLCAKGVFRRNTVYNVGASEGVILPTRGPSLCELNYVHHVGIVQSDGALIQCHGIKLNGTVIRYNWVHDQMAFHWGGVGIRGDDLTHHLIVHHNVAWNCREKAIMIKGDDNAAYNNSCFDNPAIDLALWACKEPFKPWAKAQHAHLVEVQNAHSKAYNNYAPVLAGQMVNEIRRDGAIKLPPSELSHNYLPVLPKLLDADALEFRDDVPMLVHPAGYDFRPRQGSPLIDAGRKVEGVTDGYAGRAPDLGAYERGADSYWIPGYQAKQASRPIPGDGAESPATRTDLIWLGGYRATSYDVYFGTRKESLDPRGSQQGNVFPPGKLAAGRTYHWRIDSMTPTGKVKGDVWSFTAAANRSPQFRAATMRKAPANSGLPHLDFIALDAADPDAGDWLTFAKVDGPTWLAVAPNGTLTGTPRRGDLGVNEFTVRVTDIEGASAEAAIAIEVVKPVLYVVNGSFEEPAISELTEKNYHGGPVKGWDGGKWSPSIQTRDVRARTGNQAAFRNDPKNVTFGQTMLARLEPDATYTLRYHLYGFRGHPGDCRVVGRLLVDGKVVASDTINHKAIAQNKWVLREAAYVAKPSDAGKRIRVEFIVNDLSPDKYTRFVMDDVSVTGPGAD